METEEEEEVEARAMDDGTQPDKIQDTVIDAQQKSTALVESKSKQGKGKKKVTFEGANDKRRRKLGESIGVQASSDDQSQSLHCSQESLPDGSRNMGVDDREIKNILSNIVHGIINENETEIQGKRKDRRKTGNEGRRKAAQKNMEAKEKPGCSAGRKNQGSVAVARFDACIENHLTSSGNSFIMEEGGGKFKSFERLLSGITFLRDWQSYCRFVINSKAVKFAYENKDSQIKDTGLGTVLPQFSAAAVPKLEKVSSNNSKATNSLCWGVTSAGYSHSFKGVRVLLNTKELEYGQLHSP